VSIVTGRSVSFVRIVGVVSHVGSHACCTRTRGGFQIEEKAGYKLVIRDRRDM
jgi:hypothetical protein